MLIAGPRRAGGGLALLAALAVLLPAAPAPAAGPPTLAHVWVGEVSASSARVHAQITPNGFATSYHFDYILAATYEANLAATKDGFAGATKVPAGSDPTAGSGATPLQVSQQLSSLSPETTYRYRAVTKNAAGTVASAALLLTTQGFGGGPTLLDNRGWELVSPVDKNGGQTDAPETIAGGGVFQAAAQGGALTYSAAASFGAGAQGAPQGSQYIATRAAAGWSTENITAPMLSGSYGNGPVGVPYQLFSEDLGRGLLLSGRHCRDGGSGCPVENPPLAGTEAPAGYQNYYLRESSNGSFAALLDAADLAHTSLAASQFDLSLAGASTDLGQVVLETCAALTAAASEVPDGEGCDGESPNLYAYSGAGLSLVNSAPGATLAARSGAISDDGGRIYFTQGGNLHLREGAVTKQADKDAGGGGTFQTASADGSVAFFTKAAHLWRYQAGAGTATDLTPAGEVAGVLGASEDGSYLYYLTATGLFLRHGATTTAVAAAADASNYPPATGTARVSDAGTRLAFLSSASLTGFDNTDQSTGKADSQVYLYDANAPSLACVSCNPTHARPLGPSTIPGAYANGQVPGSTAAYRPRALSADGNRLFFNSGDTLVLTDTNAAADVYEWEAQGTGSCVKAGGCVALLSSGKDAAPASFLDASADGADAYFLTERSLYGPDPGAIDIYDARVGGGFPLPPNPIPCEGDACQSLPSEPEDPAVTSLTAGPGNPPVSYPKRHRKHQKHRKHKHPQKKHQQKKHRQNGGRR
jgi:hypothetical protein